MYSGRLFADNLTQFPYLVETRSPARFRDLRGASDTYLHESRGGAMLPNETFILVLLPPPPTELLAWRFTQQNKAFAPPK